MCPIWGQSEPIWMPNLTSQVFTGVHMTRQEFVRGLSVLSRGTFQERLQWAFSLYDVNGDGIITKEEMLDIVTAIYEMMGRYTEPSIDDTTAREHVERVFTVSTRGSKFELKMGQIDPKWGQSRDFLDQSSVHFGSASQNVLKSDLKKSRIYPILGQSDPFWAQ